MSRRKHRQLIARLSLLGVSFLLGLPASAQPVRDTGIFSRVHNSDVPSPINGKTWNAQTFDGNLYYFNNAGQWVQRTPPNFNLNGIGPPTPSNDTTQGYAPGSTWYDTLGLQVYLCSDATQGAAVWSQISNLSGAGGGVNPGVAKQVGYYGATGNQISGAAQLRINGPQLQVGSLSNGGSILLNAQTSNGSTIKVPSTTVINDQLVIPSTLGLAGDLPINQTGNGDIEFKTMSGDGTIDATGLFALKNVITPGSVTNANITFDANGRIISASNGSGGGSGTVTNVAATGDGTVLSASVTGSPITTSGTLALSLANAPANSVLINPSGSPAAPSYGQVTIAAGGTGLTSSPNDGQLLIGNSSTGQYNLSTLTAGSSKVGITNGNGSISIDVNQANLSLGSIGGSLNLSTQVTNTLAAANGGTGTGTNPTAGQLPIGQILNVYAPTTITGDISLTSFGLTTIQPNAVTLSQMAQLGSGQVLGNVSGSTANVSGLTKTQLTTLVNSFTSSLSGAVPPSGGGTVNFLRADGTFAIPPGLTSGTVTSVALTGDGVVFNSSVTGSPITTSGTLAPSLASQAAGTVFGNPTLSSAAPIFMTQAQTTSLINVFTSSLSGAVPASGGGTTAFLRADGTFAVPPGSGSGTVVSSTAGQLGYYASSGNAIQGNASATISGGTISLTDATLGGQLQLFGKTSGSVVINVPAIAGSTTFGLPGANGSAGDLFINQGSNASAWKTTSGDVTINSSGVLAIGANKVTLADMAQIANNTVLGNVSGSTGNVTALTSTQLTALVNQFTSGLAGDVPASGGGTTNFLRADGTWTTPPSSGTVTSFSAGNLSPIFTSSVATASTTPALTFNLSNAAANTVLGNFTGSSAAPTYGHVTIAAGGTGLTTAPNNGQLLIGDSSTGQYDLATLSAGSSKLSITNGNGSITLDVVQGNLSLGSISGTIGLTSQVSGILPIANGGLGTSTAPTSGQIVLGGSGTYAPTSVSGDVTINGSGVTAIGSNIVTLGQMAKLAANSVIGNNTGVSATPIALTQTQLTAMVNQFTSSLPGTVSGSGGGTVNFLRADNTWAAPPGSGTVSSGVTGQTPIYNGTTFVQGNPNLTMGTAGALVVGQTATVGGTIELNGPTSGSVKLQTSATAGTGTVWQFPSSNGSSGNIPINQGSNAVEWKATSGDVLLASSGSLTIQANAVTLADMAKIAQNTVIGSVTTGSTTPVALTATQLTTIPNVFSSSLQGMVPASGGGTTNFLRADGTFAAPPSSTGTVTSFSAGNLSPIFSSSVATATTTPALTFTLTNAGAHTFLGNTTGTSGAPSYSGITTGDLPLIPLSSGVSGTLSLTSQVAGILPIANGGTALSATPTDGQLLIGSTTGSKYVQATLTAGSSKFSITNGGGSISLDVNQANLSLSSIGGSLGLSQLATQANNTVVGNVSGITASPVALTTTQLTTLVNQFTSSLPGSVPASGGGTSNFLRADGTFAVPPGTATGTVTSFSAGNLSPLFTTSVATASSTPALTFSLANAAAHTYLGNSTGSTGAPSYSAITAADLPTIGIAGGGTGLTATPTDGQLLIGSTTGSKYVLSTLTAGSSKIGITNGGGSISIDVNQSNLSLSSLGGSLALSQLATQANNTVVGNVSGITAAPIALTATQLTTLVNTFSSSLSGAVPASGGGTTNFLRADGTFAVPPGATSGTVTSVSSGNLSPLFTTSVATSTTTPAISYSLSTAAAHTYLGNSTGSTAAPSYSAITTADLPLIPLSTGVSGTLSLTSQVAGILPIANGGTALSATPTDGQLLIGSTTGSKYVQATLSAGSSKISVTNGSGSISLDVVQANLSLGSIGGTLALSQLATQATNTVVGNVSGSSAAPIALTATQLTTLVNPFTSSLSGSVPASGGGTSNFLRADGTFAVPPGTATGTVTSFSAGNLSPLFTTSVATASSTPALTFTQSTAAANTLFGNFTGSTAAPTFGTISGDVTISAGVTAIGANKVTLAQMATLAANSVIGNNTGSAATPIALSRTQLTALSNTFTSSLSGDVPASGGGTTTFLRADGTFAAPGGVSIASGTAGQVITYTGSTTAGGDPNFTYVAGSNATLSLGQDTVKNGLLAIYSSNATSGQSDIQFLTTATGVIANFGGAATGSVGSITLSTFSSGTSPTITVYGGTSGNTKIQSALAAGGTLTLPTVNMTLPTAQPANNGLPLVSTTAGVTSYSTISLTTAVTGILPIANGGLGTSTAPTSGQIVVGGSGTYAPTTVTGDVTINSSGVTAIGANKVTLADMAQIANNTVLGNVSGSTGNVTALTQAQVTNLATSTITGDVTFSSGVSAIGASKVTNSQLATMAAGTFKGNITGSTANPTDVTTAQLQTALNIKPSFGGDGSDGAITTWTNPQINATTLSVSTSTGPTTTANIKINATGTSIFNSGAVVSSSGNGGAAASNAVLDTGVTGGGGNGGHNSNSAIGGGGGGAGAGSGGAYGGAFSTKGGYAGTGNIRPQLICGSGGGSTNNLGGPGGGTITIASVGSLTISSGALLSCNGTAGSSGTSANGGGGGGGGGAVGLFSQTSIAIAAGTVTVTGGNGGAGTTTGNGGGGGGGGAIFAMSPSNSNSLTSAAYAGGSGGATGTGTAGGSASNGALILVTGTPNMPLLSQLENGGLNQICDIAKIEVFLHSIGRSEKVDKNGAVNYTARQALCIIAPKIQDYARCMSDTLDSTVCIDIGADDIPEELKHAS